MVLLYCCIGATKRKFLILVALVFAYVFLQCYGVETGPGPPRDLHVSKITTKSAFLSWKPPTVAGTGGRVMYDVVCISCQPRIVSGNNLTSLSISLSLVPSTKYVFEVSSINNITVLLGLKVSSNVTFSTEAEKDQEDATNWKIILLAFLIPTASIIFITMLIQRCRLERAKKKAKDKESKNKGDVEDNRDATNGGQESGGQVKPSSNDVKQKREMETPPPTTNTQSDQEEIQTVPDLSMDPSVSPSSYTTIKKTTPESKNNDLSMNTPKPANTHSKIKKVSTVSIKNEDQELYVNIDKYEMPRECLQLIKPLGEGFFGYVYMGTATELPVEYNEPQVAIKTIKEDMVHFDEDFLHELQILRTLNRQHEHVIKLLGCCTNNGPSYIILEYAENGDLYNYLQQNRKGSSNESQASTIPLITKLDISRMIAEGMDHLAANCIIHRDLACRNILLNSRLEAKISDFGLARTSKIDGTYVKGPKMAKLPLRWMAPESVLEGIYSSKSDVWSFGVVLWEIASNGEMPYPNFESEEMPTILKSKYRMEKPAQCPNSLYSVMMQCWQEKAVHRPSFTDLKKLDLWALGTPIMV